ncbi:glucose-6-phosphate isomerase [Candidatus Erwinia haradaeae]|uniref:Glucose-6-phosphate isomerase n=1 Tax=Candidatus Erwinia haradaeae TaxID=1922217 RepID=A0A451DLA1_9GAMM|nr:glucose-6-phosphate isomerase [Candidatus Erwinia haradaeae]VFP87543.1 Glucose-6-phosphate isomerase [Candidatus Erwinia haradaeae]
MKNFNPTYTAAWQALKDHFKKMKNVTISELFSNDAQRFSNFSISFQNQMLVDFSKNIITSETLDKLQELARETNLHNAIKSMFSSEKINYTEDRAVLHIALRNRENIPIIMDGQDVMPQVNAVLQRMKVFAKEVIHGQWKGFTGKAITDVVNIGIGGSDLGPYMVTEALRPYRNHLRMHFVSNIDYKHLAEVLSIVTPDTTLFLIASKTFTTQETITNARSARTWFLTSGRQVDISKHFIALSSNQKAANDFGVNTNNIFELWDWVGGRYSVWSSIGLSIALSIGFENFEELLSGAHAMDRHFYEVPSKKNLPILLALISIWYSNFFHSETEAILPYDQSMHRFVAYIQQCNMESNGKDIDRAGRLISYQTSPIIWGEVGTNGQHSFYQLLHQGTKLIPCDFIAPAVSWNTLSEHHNKLIANFFAQTEVLAFGKTGEKIKKEYAYNQSDFSLDQKAIIYKALRGNRPTNSIFLRYITPYTLGSLMALYEHKIFTQGAILNIFSFDQWGVEMSKKAASRILFDLSYAEDVNGHDSSTNGLINCYKLWRKL